MIVKQRYNLMLNPNIVKILDNEAERSLVSRSELVGEILLLYINEHDLVCSYEDSDISGQVDFSEVILK